ncbi:MAG: type II toxin-antitoxin system VapC family toxin [Thermoplasmatota archaeon]
MTAHLKSIAGDDVILLPAQAAIEYAAGENDSNRAYHGLETSFQIRYVDADLAKTCAAVAQRAVKHRKPVPWSDVTIAATAVHEGTYVVTRNKRHMRDVLRADVWDYSARPAPP